MKRPTEHQVRYYVSMDLQTMERESMSKGKTILAFACTAALALFTLGGCAGDEQPESPASSEPNTAAEEAAASREEVEAILNRAIEADYDSVTFSSRTDTSATGSTADGQMQTQTMRTTMRGQLDRGGETPVMHMAYEAQSNVQLGKTQYEMFIDKDNLIVSQGGQLYVDAMDPEMLDGYAQSVTAVTSAEEVSSILDMAGSLKVDQANDDTVVTITVDRDKLAESQMVDTSSLPDSTQIATMVVNYVIDDQDRFKTVRIMSSTSGTPTYRVQQTYDFSDYDATELPEWPDLDAYVAEQSGIMTDADGRMYIVGDDGQTYYVTEIGDDGMIYYNTGADNTGYGSGGDTEYYYVDDPDASATTGDSTSTDADEASSSDDLGRAYITDDDGNIHYLDEGRTIDAGGGWALFYDENGGGPYWLNYGDDEDE